MITVPNLLVTDDDSAFRQVLREALERRGFVVSEACDGQEAIEVMSKTRVHVALVDVHMPRVTGLQVMEYLLQSPQRPACVLMSAKLDAEIEQEAKRMQAYRVLSKPIRLSQLSDVVCTALAELYDWRPPKSFA